MCSCEIEFVKRERVLTHFHCIFVTYSHSNSLKFQTVVCWNQNCCKISFISDLASINLLISSLKQIKLIYLEFHLTHMIWLILILLALKRTISKVIHHNNIIMFFVGQVLLESKFPKQK